MKILKIFLAALLLAASDMVAAGGMAVHMFQSDIAFQLTDEPDLKQLLQTHKDAWISGTQYPDAGYVPGFLGQPSHVWGEESHWAPFIVDYLKEVKKQCAGRYLSNEFCGQLAAHFLGAAAHGIQDQVFDLLFIAKVTEVDHKGQETTDIGIDMILLSEHDRDEFVPQTWFTPVDVLEQVYQNLGFSEEEANRAQIITTTNLSAFANRGERIISPFLYWYFKNQMPWGSRNYMTYPGGVEYGGEVTANFWRYLWQRLNDINANDVLVTHLPRANAVNVPIDKRNTESQVSVTFDRYVVPNTVNHNSFRVIDGNGRDIAGTIRMFANTQSRTAKANTIYFRPDETLSAATQYRVVLTSDILDETGVSLLGEGGYQWSFTTETHFDYFQLVNQGLCLGMRGYALDQSTFDLELHHCRQTRHQHWYWDEYGRIRSRERNDLCLVPERDRYWPSVRIQAATCEYNSHFVWHFDGEDGTLSTQDNQRYGLGTFFKPWPGVKALLFYQRGDERQQWQLEPVAVDTACPNADVYTVCW